MSKEGLLSIVIRQQEIYLKHRTANDSASKSNRPKSLFFNKC